MVEQKMNLLHHGYSAYAESEDLIRMMKEEIMKQNLPVIIDQTDNGCWFFPESLSN